MIHHVAADLIGTVGDPVWIAVVCRHQEQLGIFEAIAGEHEKLAGDTMCLFVLIEVMDSLDLVLCIGLHLVDDRIGKDRGAFVFQPM